MDRVNIMGIIILLIGIGFLIVFQDFFFLGYNLVIEELMKTMAFDFLGFFGIMDVFFGWIIVMIFASPIFLGLFLIYQDFLL